MKKITCLFIALLLIPTISFTQNDITLLPFISKEKTEVIRAYSRKNGKTVEWYYDNTTKKMQKSGEGFQLPSTGITSNLMMKAYIGADGSEVILVWNSATGKSESWYFDVTEKKIKKGSEGYQLPENIGLSGNVMMFPFIGTDGSEVILCWESASGKSVSFYYFSASYEYSFLNNETVTLISEFL